MNRNLQKIYVIYVTNAEFPYLKGEKLRLSRGATVVIKM